MHAAKQKPEHSAGVDPEAAGADGKLRTVDVERALRALVAQQGAQGVCGRRQRRSQRRNRCSHEENDPGDCEDGEGDARDAHASFYGVGWLLRLTRAAR
jgi:hypothetical protein